MQVTGYVLQMFRVQFQRIFLVAWEKVLHLRNFETPVEDT